MFKIYLLLFTLLFINTTVGAEQHILSKPRVRESYLTLSDRNYSLKPETTHYVPSEPLKISDEEFEEVLEHIRKLYMRKMDMEALRKKAKKEGIPAMLKSLDPHSEYLPPVEQRNRGTRVEGLFGGVGIRIESKDGQLTVMTPIPNTSAYRAGVQPGDIIVEIEGESTEGITLQEAVKKLRGHPGTSVALKIQRGKGIKIFNLTREIIKIESVQYKMLQPEIGYIKIHEFTTKTDTDLIKALKELSSKGMKKLILDLRNNPGGFLNMAINITKKFLGGNKLIAYTEERKIKRIEYRAELEAPFESIPLIVLVNKGSAGGSELLAGALQDHGRAKIVGAKTFGKASIQSVIPLSRGGGLRLTTATFYTPKGRRIQYDEKTGKGGITPDLPVEISEEEELKLRRQEEQIFPPGKEPISIVPKEEQIEDPYIQKALELLK